METSSLIQFLSYAAMMASSIFVPLMAQSFGASPGMVGIIVGTYNFFYLFASYVFGILTDKYGGKMILILGLFLSIIFFATQVLAKDIFSLFLVRSLAGAATGIFPAALTVYAYHEYKGKLGKFTGSGSLGWAIGAILAGLISLNQTIFIMSSVFFVVAFFLSLQIKSSFMVARPKVKLLPLGLAKRNARVYVPYFFRSLGAQAIWAIFPLYLVWTGADKLWVGIAYFVNTFSQFFIMQYIEKYRNLVLVNLGLLGTVATFIGYAIFPHIAVVLILQLLLAFSFSALQVGSLQELLDKNIELSTATSLLNFIANFTAFIGPFLAGAMVELYGYPGLMWMGAAFSFIGLVSFTSVLE